MKIYSLSVHFLGPGNTWKHLETPGNTWKRLETPGNAWKRLETPGNAWKRLETPPLTDIKLKFYYILQEAAVAWWREHRLVDLGVEVQISP